MVTSRLSRNQLKLEYRLTDVMADIKDVPNSTDSVIRDCYFDDRYVPSSFEDLAVQLCFELGRVSKNTSE